MYDEATATLGGDVKGPVAKPKTRAERIEAWRDANRTTYLKACHDAQCTCTPTRAQMLLMDAWESPPID
jgi:hypothetical protein